MDWTVQSSGERAAASESEWARTALNRESRPASTEICPPGEPLSFTTVVLQRARIADKELIFRIGPGVRGIKTNFHQQGEEIGRAVFIAVLRMNAFSLGEVPYTSWPMHRLRNPCREMHLNPAKRRIKQSDVPPGAKIEIG